MTWPCSTYWDKIMLLIALSGAIVHCSSVYLILDNKQWPSLGSTQYPLRQPSPRTLQGSSQTCLWQSNHNNGNCHISRQTVQKQSIYLSATALTKIGWVPVNCKCNIWCGKPNTAVFDAYRFEDTSSTRRQTDTRRLVKATVKPAAHKVLRKSKKRCNKEKNKDH